jgi:hypothetical protein
VKRAALLPLAASALLVAAAALRLPRPYSLLSIETNPFRRTLSPFDGRLYALAWAASPSIPAGARVAVESGSGRAGDTIYCAMVARSLLPGRDVRAVPAAPGWKPEFLIRVGARGAARPREARPIFRLAEGDVWKLAS